MDKAGRIAYIGSPMYLGVVLPKVLAGDAPQAVSSEVGKIEEAWNRISLVQTCGDDKVTLKAILDFEAKYPPMAKSPLFGRAKLNHLVRAGDVHEARKFAEAMMAKAIEQDDPGVLTLVSIFLRQGQGKESKELLAVAAKAAEARVKVAGDKDVRALIDLADAYCAVGDKAKARESARKAGQAAGGKDAGSLINLADTYCTIGDKAEAREHARKAGQAAGDKDAGILFRLANIYFAMGDKAEAREYARKAVAAAAGEYAALTQYIEQAARKFDDEKQEDKK